MSNISKRFQFRMNDCSKSGKCFSIQKIIESHYSNTAVVWNGGEQLQSLGKHNGDQQVVYSSYYV